MYVYNIYCFVKACFNKISFNARLRDYKLIKHFISRESPMELEVP